MMEENLIVLKSAYNKTEGQVFFIQPCKDPFTQTYPPCVREVSDPKTHQMILSEEDKKFMSKGGQLLPASKPIKVQHGTTFDLNNPLQAAQWEAIKHSPFIALDRLEKDSRGVRKVDGEKPYATESGMIGGKYGLADLYIERPGNVSKTKNNLRKLILKAQGLVVQDTIDGWITKCKLLEKNMAHANPNDIEDYLLTQAEKYPEKIIELYTGSTTAIRLLIITGIDKNILVKRNGLLIYADDIVLGASVDAAVTFLGLPENIKLKELIQQEVYPEMYKRAEDKTPAKTIKK